MAAKNGAIKLVAGNSNPALADAIAAYLKTPMTKAVVRRFADMEIFVEIQENVRGSDVFVIQSTSFPANDHLMELLIIIDALRRASGRRITAVIPYFGYARQDRKPGPRTPISAKLVANLITNAGADRVMTLDLHAGQIQGFFDIPTDNLYASPMMVRDIKEHFELGKVAIVSPDVGGVARARGLAKRINAPLAIVDKRRERAGESEVMNVIGDVEGHICILVDDIIDSGGTVVNAADALLEKGGDRGLRLHHARRALGRRGRAHHRLAAEGTRHHRLDPADRGRQGRPQYPRHVGRDADRRGDRTHRRRGVGVQPVRLKPPRCLIRHARARRGHSGSRFATARQRRECEIGARSAAVVVMPGHDARKRESVDSIRMTALPSRVFPMHVCAPSRSHQAVDKRLGSTDIHQSLTGRRPNCTLAVGIKALYSSSK